MRPIPEPQARASTIVTHTVAPDSRYVQAVQRAKREVENLTLVNIYIRVPGSVETVEAGLGSIDLVAESEK